MNLRAIARVLLCMQVPALLIAQAPNARVGKMVASVGAGWGSVAFTCDACPSGRDNGVSAVVHLGVGVRDNVVIGAEATGWTADYRDPRGTATARMVFANAVARWYPKPDVPAFVKMGGGAAWIRDAITIDGLAETIVTTHAPAIVLGAGWDLRRGGRWSVTPYFDVDVALKADLSVNGSREDTRLGANLIHLGAAIAIR